jgi:putative ABC transport system permease protein
MFQDLKLAARVLAKSPASTAAMVLAIALAIGANSAIFSVLDAVLLRPLAFPDADRLVTLWGTREGRPPDYHGNFSVADFLDLRAQSTSFEGLAAYRDSSIARNDGTEPEHLGAGVVSSNFFETLGVRPALGRTFALEEETEGNDRVVLVGDAYWRRAFGSDPATVDRKVLLDGKQYTVVGVLPAGFRAPMFGREPDVWIPLSYKPAEIAENRGAHYIEIVGRLRADADVAKARADVGAVGARLGDLYPPTNAGRGVDLGPLQEELVGDVRPILYVMLGAVVLVLLIACANVANLLLAQATGRGREVAVRVALGASRWQLVRQFLVESVLVAAAGAALGLGLAWWGVEALVAMAGDALPPSARVGIDLRVLAFTAALAVASGVVFGLAPAFQASNVDPHEALAEGGRGGTAGRGRIRSAFVVAQVALSLVLLVGSGLLLRSLYLLKQVDPGFNAKGVLTMEVSLPDSPYDSEEKQTAFARQLVERARGVPGVTAAAAVYPIAYSDSNLSLTYLREGQPEPTRAADRTAANWRPITADYFRVMQIPVLTGRAIEDRDTASAPHVMVINETLAKKAFPDEDPLGKRLTIGWNDMTFEIVGVVGDIRFASLKTPPVPEMYTPFDQTPWGGFNFIVRTEGDPTAVAGLVRDQVWAIDRNIPVFGLATMEQRVSDSLTQQRFSTLLIGLFAAVALALATVGIYAVLAYTVETRRREIGVRMALGAERRHVLGLVVGRGMALALVGIALGVAGAFGATRVMASMLFGVGATDPVAFATVTAGLAAVALAACYIPARRAARIDPADALRSE